MQKARESFGTTSEIAVWHLKNHKFIGWDVADELVTEPVAAQVVVHTSLPRSGVYPADAPPGSLRSGFETSVVLAKAVAKRAPVFCEDAARVLLLNASTTENELEATDDLLLELDRHLARVEPRALQTGAGVCRLHKAAPVGHWWTPAPVEGRPFADREADERL